MTPCTCHPGNVCASAASCAAARRVEFGDDMTTTQAGALPEFVTAIDYADNPNDATTNMIDVRVPIGTRLALQSQPAAATTDGAPAGMLRTTCPYCEQGFAFDRPEADASDELVDQHLDAILRAAGSALRHYTMQKSKDDMRSALRRAILALRPQSDHLDTARCIKARNDLNAALHGEGALIDDLEHAVANACAILKRRRSLAGDRADFEEWMSEGGKWPKAVERGQNGDYLLLQTATNWITWQACASLRPQAVPMTDAGSPGLKRHAIEASDRLARYAAAPFFPETAKRGVVRQTTPEWWDGLAELIEEAQPLIARAQDEFKRAHHGITAQGAQGGEV